MNVFLDSNIILRFLTNDSPLFSPKSKAIFNKIAQRETLAYINVLVLHEVIYILEHVYKVNRKVIGNKVGKLIQLPNLSFTDLDKSQVVSALKDYTATHVDFPDCVYKQIASEKCLKLLSFDKDFSKLKVDFSDTLQPRDAKS